SSRIRDFSSMPAISVSTATSQFSCPTTRSSLLSPQTTRSQSSATGTTRLGKSTTTTPSRRSQHDFVTTTRNCSSTRRFSGSPTGRRSPAPMAWWSRARSPNSSDFPGFGPALRSPRVPSATRFGRRAERGTSVRPRSQSGNSVWSRTNSSRRRASGSAPNANGCGRLSRSASTSIHRLRRFSCSMPATTTKPFSTTHAMADSRSGTPPPFGDSIRIFGSQCGYRRKTTDCWRRSMFESSISDGVLRLRRPGMRWLSTGWNGGFERAATADNIEVPEGWNRTDLETYVAERRERAGVGGGGPALLTGVSMRHARGARLGPVEAHATAGVSNPAALPMDPTGADLAATGPSGHHVGTVNVIVGTTHQLDDGALSTLLAVVAEAKTATLLATTSFTGTTTDAVVVGSDESGKPETFAGSA